MTGVEITLILAGIFLILGSFFVQEKLSPRDVDEITRLSEKELKIIVERQLKRANDEVEASIDEMMDESMEIAKRAMEKETNEKIMAINEYANTVIESMNKTHNEILFLYNMLNDKHTELTGLVSQLQQFMEQVKKTEREIVDRISDAVNDVPRKKETTVPEYASVQRTAAVQKTSAEGEAEAGKTPSGRKRTPVQDVSSFNDQVLYLHQNGASDVEIARQLGRGLGEVKLVLGLYKGEDVSEI